METAVFGGGCFWCTEAVFKMMKGVSSVMPGYAGGETENPTYEQVCSGSTGHAEVVEIKYDPKEVKYEDLLTVFFGSHDPTTLNRQGNDIGTQYRSVIFYTTDKQRDIAKGLIDEANKSNEMEDTIVTEVMPLTNFYVAENYHQDYFSNHKDEGYCQIVINPKLEKIKKNYAHLLQEMYKK